MRNALHRLLREFRKVMQAAMRLTVEDDAEVPEELAHLLGLFPR